MHDPYRLSITAIVASGLTDTSKPSISRSEEEGLLRDTADTGTEVIAQLGSVRSDGRCHRCYPLLSRHLHLFSCEKEERPEREREGDGRRVAKTKTEERRRRRRPRNLRRGRAERVTHAARRPHASLGLSRRSGSHRVASARRTRGRHTLMHYRTT